MSIDVTPSEGNYTLTKTNEDGTTQEMHLSPDEALTLAHSALRLSDHILQHMASIGGSVSPRLTGRVVSTTLNTDIHKTGIVLVMELDDGLEIGFELPFDVAKPLAERLPVRFSELEAAKSSRSKH